MKVNLSGVPETLFITLRVQAAETAKPNRRESHEI